MVLVKQSLDEWLDGVSYTQLNSAAYIPTEFALTFMNFIKLVNGEQGESHKTPPVHLKMLDKVVEPSQYIANLCFRGAAKTTLFGEYFFLFLGMFGWLPGFGAVPCAIYVSDSMDNGVKSLRKNMEFRYDNSPFLQEWIPKATFTDNYIEFENRDGQKFGLKMFGAKTGLRGTKIFGKRPPLCVLDDLVSDDDSKSKVSMQAIKDTVYKGVNHALDPTRRKVIFNGTPFQRRHPDRSSRVGCLGRERLARVRAVPLHRGGVLGRVGGSVHLGLCDGPVRDGGEDREGGRLHAGAHAPYHELGRATGAGRRN